jgi:hypothetical protein
LFNIRSGDVLNKDPEGEEHEDLASAENEAIESAREMMAEEVKSGRAIARGKMFELTAVTGRVLSTIVFAEAIHLSVGTNGAASINGS